MFLLPDRGRRSYLWGPVDFADSAGGLGTSTNMTPKNDRLVMVALVLGALSMIGADNCALLMIGQPVPTSSSGAPPTSGGNMCSPSSGQGGAGGAGVGGAGSGGSGVGGSGVGGGPGAQPQGMCDGSGTDPFAGVPASVANNSALKASALAYYLDGMISSSGVDPSNQTALAALLAQDAPKAEMDVASWLASLDPAAIPTAAAQPRYDCTDQHQCPYSAMCINSGPWSQQSYACWVTDCGNSACTSCPSWFPDTIKSPIFASWCAYVCETQTSPPSPVAVGVVGVRADGKTLPANKLAWCFPP